MVALVRGVHGLHGAVRVEVLTDHPAERYAPGHLLHREGSEEPLTIVEAAPDGPGWRLRLAEVRDRTAADALRNAYLEAVVGPGEELGRGEYYWHEVVGRSVRDLAGTELGHVLAVYRSGEIDVYVVRGDRYGEFDLPAVRDFVRIFAPRRNEIFVDVDALELTPRPVRPPRPERPRRGSRRGISSGAPADAAPALEAAGTTTHEAATPNADEVERTP